MSEQVAAVRSDIEIVCSTGVDRVFLPENTIPVDAAYAARVHDVNMPFWASSDTRGNPTVPISEEVQTYMSALALQSVGIPRSPELTVVELFGARDWLEGKTAGLTDLEAAQRVGIATKTFKKRAQGMFSYLGAANQAHAMYLARLHGYTDPVSDHANDTPPHIDLTTNEALHLYMGAKGRELSEIAELLHITQSAAKSSRNKALQKFGAKNLPQAIARAFECGHYRSIQTYEQVALFGLMDVLRPVRPTPKRVASYVAYEAAMNRPSLIAVDDGPGRRSAPKRELDPEARQHIAVREGKLVTNLFTSNVSFNNTQAREVQTLIDDITQGKTRDQIAASLYEGTLPYSEDTVSRLNKHIGTDSVIASTYAMLLHGYRPARNTYTPDRLPTMPRNMWLHLRLAAIGCSVRDAMDLAQHNESIVTYNRNQAIRRLGASTMSQAIAHAFALGIFKPLPHMSYV